MSLNLYLKPFDSSKIPSMRWGQKRFTIGSLLEKNKEKLPPEKAKVVLIGVDEDRNSVVKGSSKAPDKIREHLYCLNRIDPRFKLLDLGNLKRGKTVQDTYFALSDVCSYFIEQGITVVVMGGSQDLTFGMTKAFDEKQFNLVNIDPKLDYSKGAKSLTSENYLNIIFEKQKSLFSQVTLGYQNYFTDSLELQHISDVFADIRRIGQLRYNMAEIEPYMRNTDVLSFDLNSVRLVEAPGQYFASPNGLYAEEACQVAHYAGMSDQIKIAGFFNLIPRLDSYDLSSKLMAQIIWHFFEGQYYKIVETPNEKAEEFNQYIIEMDDVDLPLTFYQSRKTGRWWMKIIDENNNVEQIVPCMQEDYDMASRYEIPDRWWRNIRKLNRFLK